MFSSYNLPSFVIDKISTFSDDATAAATANHDDVDIDPCDTHTSNSIVNGVHSSPDVNATRLVFKIYKKSI